MTGGVVVAACDPRSDDAIAMSEALWAEIQHRYGFVAVNPFDGADFTGPIGGFWLAVASSTGKPVGSIALRPLEDDVAELDVMYVSPSHRGTGTAQALLAALEAHARATRITVLRLRAGDPQPEAMRFYAASGFTPIPPFGRWTGDDTARCFEKEVSTSEETELAAPVRARTSRAMSTFRAPRRDGGGDE